MSMDIDLVQALHGRAPSVATGVKRMRPDSIVFTIQGDGDMVNEGLQEVLHTAARGENVTCILLNNGVFGETGGHMTATTVIGQRTKNSLDGRDAGVPRLPDPHRRPDRAAPGRGVRRRGARCTTRARSRARSGCSSGRSRPRSTARASRSSRSSRCARPAGSSRPLEGPDYMNDTLGEVHIMGELKVDGVVRTTEELHEENVRKAAEMEQALARGGIDHLMDFTYPPEAEEFRKEFRPGSTSTSPTSSAPTASASRWRWTRAARDDAGVEPHARRRALRRDLLARGVRRARRRDHGAGGLRRGDAPLAARRAR